MNPQEAQQVKTIAEIVEKFRTDHAKFLKELRRTNDIGLKDLLYANQMRANAIKVFNIFQRLVDSQAQKIAEQAKEMSAQNIELINLRYQLQTARIQAEGVRSDIICGETSYLRQYLDGHEFPWEKQ